MANIDSKLSGTYRMLVGEPYKPPRIDTGPFHNLITNLGMDQFATTVGEVYNVQVGSGSSTPAFTDVNLGNYIAGTAWNGSPQYGMNNVAGARYGWIKYTYVFAQGAAAGNLTEVGVSAQKTSGNLFSRALILDDIGNPTTITVLPNEILTVIYEFRIYFSDSDVLGSIVINGITYNTTMRPINVTDTSDWIQLVFSTGIAGQNDTWRSIQACIAGPLLPVTSTYPGSNARANSLVTTYSPYISGSHERTRNVTAGINDFNVSGGIGGLVWRSAIGSWQMIFDSTIPKDNTKTFTISFKHTWSRM